ncbi:class A beta-lactamase [Janthinobacterium sp. GW460P]|uniref:class A beta-lactamase n=1 Tax=unclassified Janthinobacterium TaxID=2610881 RepID=UPI000A320E98|nr:MULTISPECIES: class A beta-lactamase [unclassified Janthinobacterium]MCC7701623.1 class A beta-lactamase [Janthinobacterium sp. GW460P]MCC7707130.1 class A beta-lactamase [Janthinobacterium sp. GW460W]
MTESTNHLRRHLLLAGGAALLCPAPLLFAAPATSIASAHTQLAALEQAAGGRLGVSAWRQGGELRIAHRADERFPLCSTFKAMLAAAVLAHSASEAGLLAQRVRYEKKDLVTYSPITEKHLADGMTVAELCAATLQYSDNSAANFLMKILGGPQAVTAYARSIGNKEFQLERWETELNSAIPGEVRDTASPASMARSMEQLLLGDGLPAPQRQQLDTWMRGNTTGDKRIRPALPDGWKVADKTGSGAYGSINDIGVAYPPVGAPLVIAVYYTRELKNADNNQDIITAATRIVAAALV